MVHPINETPLVVIVQLIYQLFVNASFAKAYNLSVYTLVFDLPCLTQHDKSMMGVSYFSKSHIQLRF